MQRRPPGEAAEIILKTLSEAHPEGLTFSTLRDRTGLAVPTLRENVTALRKSGIVKTVQGNDRAMWVCLPE